MDPHYDQPAIVRALRAVGLRAGDAAFSHSSVAMLGIPAMGLDEQAVATAFLAAFREVLGPEGTLVLPAFTYSYTKREVFDPAATPPTPGMGVLPTALWTHPDAVRSLDPIFSVIAFGARARELAGEAGADNCFGPDSVWARLLAADAAILNIGIGSHAALIHHVEQKLGVPYRYIKRFPGTTVVDGVARESVVAYNVAALDRPQDFAYFMRLDADGRASGAVATAPLGRGEVNLIRAREMERLIAEGLARDPRYLVVD